MNGNPLFILAPAALLCFLLYRNLPGALLFLRPGLTRVYVEGGPAEVVPSGHGTAIAQMLEEVAGLGFEPLGVKWEKKPLGMRQKEFVFASAADRCFAGVMPVTNEAWLYFFTPFQSGATVITADFKWPAADESDYLAGGLPAATPVEVLNAHRRRVQRLVDAGQRPLEPLTLSVRESSSIAFYASGPGKRETRRRELVRVVFTGAALAYLGFLLKAVVEKFSSAGS